MFRSDPEGRRALFELETGELTEPEFEERFAALLGLRPDRAPGMIDRLFGGMKADIVMFDAVRAAKRSGHPDGAPVQLLGVTATTAATSRDLFDAVVISGEEGMRKPDRAIYELAIERMALPADDIVFVDDLPGNLAPARDLGMATVHHENGLHTVSQLEHLFHVPLDERPPGGRVGEADRCRLRGACRTDTSTTCELSIAPSNDVVYCAT